MVQAIGESSAYAVTGDNSKEGKSQTWGEVALKVFLLLFMLWLFLFGLGLMGDSFKVLGGKSAGNLFSGISNPLAGLMVGILATVLVQSSSTSTSIVVGLVASGIMDVQTAIPIIMGANIGTSITNTLVSMGHLNDKNEFARAFAGATVHDMFNYLSVAVLLPIEVITDAMNGGDGGLLFMITKGMTESLEGADGGSFTSPVKAIAGPATKAFISVDKDKIKALSMGVPTLETCLGSLAKPKVVAKVSYTICGNQTALDETLAAWNKKIIDGSLIKGGAFEGEDDNMAGVICLILSLIALCLALYAIVKIQKSLIMGGNSNESKFARLLDMNGYLAILVGAGMTVVVQSSSIITSMLVPLVGVGTLSVEKMLPLTLGANIGTTCTALLAALAAGKASGLQIALCHLFFNIFGILIFFPISKMRMLPVRAAHFLGYLTVCFKWFAFAYIGVAFFLAPLLLLGISSLISEGGGLSALGWTLLVLLMGGLVALFVLYKYMGYKARVSAFLEKKFLERELSSKPSAAVSPLTSEPVAIIASVPIETNAEEQV